MRIRNVPKSKFNMAETEERKETAPETADVERTEESAKVEKQKKIVADLVKRHEEDPSDELSLTLNRERDLLRHLLLVQKGNPKERASAKAEYAAKAALSRAIQPVE